MALALAISGSPRPGGNSETLLAAALEPAASAGLDTDLIRLNPLTYRGCQACGQCLQGRDCPLRDDLTSVLERLATAQIWLLGSPIYYDGLSGQFKTFVDRCRCFRHADRKLKGPCAGAVVVTYEADPIPFYEEVAKRTAAYLSWWGAFKPIETLAVARLGPPEAAAQNEKALDMARDLGTRLVQGLG